MFKLQLQHQSFQWIPRISSKVLKRKRGELNQAGESFVLLVGALRVPTWEGRRAEEKLKIKMHALKQWHLAKWLDSWHYTSSYAISKRFLWAPVLLRKARLEVGIRTFYTKTWSCFNRTFRKELFSSFIYLLFVKKKKKKKTCFYPKEYSKGKIFGQDTSKLLIKKKKKKRTLTMFSRVNLSISYFCVSRVKTVRVKVVLFITIIET